LDNCLGRFAINNLNICRATQFCPGAVSPWHGEISRFCVWSLTVNTVDVLSNTSRTDISTFVDVSRWSYMIFIRTFHSQLSRNFFRTKIVDIMSDLVGLQSPKFIWLLSLNSLYISHDVPRWIFSISLLKNCVEFTRNFVGRFSWNVLDIFSGVSPSV